MYPIAPLVAPLGKGHRVVIVIFTFAISRFIQVTSLKVRGGILLHLLRSAGRCRRRDPLMRPKSLD